MADPVSLLDQFGSNPTAGLMSLLTPIISGGAIQAPPGGAMGQGQLDQSLPAWLAFASTLARAGGKTLGPPPTTAEALTSGLGAGYGAAAQASILPALGASAQRAAQMQEIDLERAANELKWSNAINSIMVPRLQGMAPGAEPPTPGAPAAPVAPIGTDSLGPPASQDQIAALPDVQRLPPVSRVPAILTMAKAGLSLNEAGQYARMLIEESGGLHIDPKSGGVLTSNAGAKGVGQVMPGTFAEMAAKYGINGSVNDMLPNLEAGARYFHEGALENGILGGTIRYNAGPKGLERYVSTGELPAQTSSYLVRTQTPTAGGRPIDQVSSDIQDIIAGMKGAGAGQAGQPMLPLFAGPGAPQTPATPGAPLTPGGPATAAPPLTPMPIAPPNPGAASQLGNEPMVREPLTGQMIPRSVMNAAIMGMVTPRQADAMTGYRAPILQWLQSQQAAATTARGNQVIYPPGLPGMGQKPATGEVVAQPQGEAYADTLSPEEIEKFVPNKIPNMDYIGDRYATGPLTGQFKPGSIKPLSPRTAALPFQQLDVMEDQIQKSYAMEQWQKGQARYDSVMAALNQQNRVGDNTAIENFAKMFDPGAVVTEGKLKVAADYGGAPGRVQEFLSKFTQGTALTPETRQAMGEMATQEQQARDVALLDQIARTRASAAARGVDPQKVMPGFSTLALPATDERAQQYQGLGAGYRQPYVYDPTTGRFARPREAPAPELAPATPAPATGPPRAPGTAPAPAPAATAPGPAGVVLTPAQIGQLNEAGIRNALTAYQRNRAAYPAEYIGQLRARLDQLRGGGGG